VRARPPVPLISAGFGSIWRIPFVGDYLNGFLFRDPDGQLTLLDVGLRRSAPAVLAALAEVGAAPTDVTRILLSHGHSDHAGSAAELSRCTGREVAAHAADAAYLRAGKATPRSGHGRLVPAAWLGYPPVPVGATLADGDLLDVAGGLRVVHTPGHTPGHLSFLHEESGLLITGDSIFNVAGLRWPVRSFCANFRLTQQTAARLGELDYTMAAFTHGPEIRHGARESIRRFLVGDRSRAVGGGT